MPLEWARPYTIWAMHFLTLGGARGERRSSKRPSGPLSQYLIRAHQPLSCSSATTHPRIVWIATRPGSSALRMMVRSWNQSSSSARSINSRTAPAMKSGAIMAAAAARCSIRAMTSGSSDASTVLATSGRSRLAIRFPSMRPPLHLASIRRKSAYLLEQHQAMTTGDSTQNSDQTDEQEDSVQPFNRFEGCFRVHLGSVRIANGAG